ncbi:formate dehydrogenase subunit gamma [Phenylobacterium sp.]|jgi:formate dehydrogenase subunit gamma|uniref:formate dehydrogenase subunit gamma n=1 Tax=Phenylobacterium sp. TaxID=1871053 RepID=UPI001201827E|nr:formate dehydrogenase subunit gamma [Phenylobacterium sp.]THD63449.1 MAG: formate dehydrogenase subunit gamma [Phenylobacterium sp.]
MSRSPENVVRYATVTRVNHWITAICFVLLTLSGLAMFHPIFFFLSALFGGGQWTRAVHPWIGIALVASYAGLVAQFWRENMWNQDDTAWVRKFDLILQNQEEGVPEVGQFNAGQKFVFWAMVLLIPALLFTGLVIWEVYFGGLTPLLAQRIAVLLHSFAAIAAIAVWITHVYAGIWVRGSLRAMTRGDVTPGWAWRHHRKWLRELARRKSSGPQPRAEGTP